MCAASLPQRPSGRAACLLLTLGLLWAGLACSSPSASPAAPAKPAAGVPSGSAPAAQAPSAGAPAASATDPLAPLPTPARVRFASSATNANQTALWVARDQGYFAQYGLDVDASLVGASTVWQAALTNGELDYVQTGLTGVTSGLLADQDRVAIGAVVNLTEGNIYSQPSLTTPRDLVGREVATTRFGTNSDMAIRLSLPAAGLQPDTDVRIVQTGGFPESLAALRAGAVSAAYLDPPQSYAAEDAGYRALVPAEVDIGPTQFVTTRATLARQPAVPLRLMAAMMEAVHLLVTDQQAAAAAYTKQLGVDDPAVLERTWQSTRNRYVRDLQPSRDAARNVLGLLAQSQPDAASLSYEQLVDTSYLQQLYATGLYERLYGGAPPALR